MERNLICKYCDSEKNITDFRKNRKKCKECEKKDGRKYRKSDIGKYNQMKWEENNKEKAKKLRSAWYQENKEKINQKYNARYRDDIDFKLHKNYQRRINSMIDKNQSTYRYLGCDSELFKKWLIYCFDNDMNINNHGTYWHMDHVIPISKFDLKNKEDVYLCFNWRNVTPYQKNMNMSKNDKIDAIQIANHYKKLKNFHKENNIHIPDNIIELYTRYLKCGNLLKP